MVRFILLTILFFIFYTVLSALLRVLGKTSSSADSSAPDAEIGNMVECCECGTYVPESDIIRRKIHTETKEFCSRECLQKFKQH